MLKLWTLTLEPLGIFYGKKYKLWLSILSLMLPMTGSTYDLGPLSQKSAHAEQYAQTKTNTNPSPDPNARIQKFIHYMAIAAICDSRPLQ